MSKQELIRKAIAKKMQQTELRIRNTPENEIGVGLVVDCVKMSKYDKMLCK